MLHDKMDIIINGSGHVAYKTEHTTYKIPPVTHKFAHNTNENMHMTYTIAHTSDRFGHNANILECSNYEYRHMTCRIHFCPQHNFKNGTPHYWLPT